MGAGRVEDKVNNGWREEEVMNRWQEGGGGGNGWRVSGRKRV